MKCKYCGKEFESTDKRKIFCDYKCCDAYHREKWKILKRIERIAKKNNFEVKNRDKIVNAKLLMFVQNDITRCPCDSGNPDRYCGSYLCKHDVLTKGHCHCNLFHLKYSPIEPTIK